MFDRINCYNKSHNKLRFITINEHNKLKRKIHIDENKDNEVLFLEKDNLFININTY